ncbi:18657_t:CDS:2, partial [Dentiscutata erythropus]
MEYALLKCQNGKPCSKEVRTSDSTTGLWRHLRSHHGYSKDGEPPTLEVLTSKPHNIVEQAIRDYAITELIIAQNLPLSFVEGKMFKRFTKIIDSRWTVPSKEKIKNLIDDGFKRILWARMLELKPYIEILLSLLTVQPEADAVADGKRLKEIMITESSSYPTMSIIYPTIISLRNVLLKLFKNEVISDFILDNTSSKNSPTLFNDEAIFSDKDLSDMDEELEELKLPSNTNNLTNLIKKTMASLFEKYYK